MKRRDWKQIAFHSEPLARLSFHCVHRKMMDISSAVFLPNELIAEILSYLSVKTLMRLRTVCKSWKALISNPTFVNLHLQRSPQNTHVTIESEDCDENGTILSDGLSVFDVRHLLDDTFCNSVELKLKKDGDDLYSYYNRDKKEIYRIAGSCNGLVCFYCRKVIRGYLEYSLNFRNLSVGTISEKLGHFRESCSPYDLSFEFSFGYDNSTGIYKVVAFHGLCQKSDSPSWTSEVKVFNLGDNSWRKIQSFPIYPLNLLNGDSDVVHLIGTVNWLALTNTPISLYHLAHINAENLVILSLSLSTETYTQLLLPKGFKEVLLVRPTLRVLRNCLCFSHDFRGTEFVIWQMREFGVRESWTQLIKVCYETLQMRNLPWGNHMYGFKLLPLYLSENSDTLIFAVSEEYSEEYGPTIIYNWKDDRVVITRFWRGIGRLSNMDYVESLVSIT